MQKSSVELEYVRLGVGRKTDNFGVNDLGGDFRAHVPTLLDTRLVITASSGQGKSMLIRRMVELVAPMAQTIVVDPEGEFSTLREKLDMLVVGQGGDIPVRVQTARLLARRLAETRVGAIIDLYDLGDWDQRREWLAEFLAGIMSLPKALQHPIFMPIDESHNFAPEVAGGKVGSPVQASRAAVAFAMSAGRKRGVCLALATQRISKLSKDAITDAKNVFIGGITWDVDQKRAADMLGFSTRDERLALRDLRPGSFWAFGPAVAKGVNLLLADEAETTHPRPGQRHLLEVPPASAAVKSIMADLEDLEAEVQAEANADAARTRELYALRDKVIELSNALEDQRPAPAKPVPMPVPVFATDEVPRLEAVLRDVVALVRDLGDQRSKIEFNMRGLEKVTSEIQKAIDDAKALPDGIPQEVVFYTGETYKAQTARIPLGRSVSPQEPDVVFRDEAPSQDRSRNGKATAGLLSGPEQKILNVLAWLESVGIEAADRVRLAFFSGYSPNTGNYKAAVSSLEDKDLVYYPSPGRVRLTADGRHLSVPTRRPATNQELQESIYGRVGKQKAAILKALVREYPADVSRSLLADKLGKSYKGGGFKEDLSDLKAMGLVCYPRPGRVAATSHMFLTRV